MIGFFFANRHSTSFWLAMENAHRPLLPAANSNEYTITGRHGTVDFGGETYQKRYITVDICFISNNVRDLQALARDIAFWLSGRGILYFDDEPDKAYDAVVHQAVDTAQIIRTKRASVVFECQPFAKTRNFLQSINAGLTSGDMVSVTSQGTQRTPCIVILRNTGTTNITNLSITRRAQNT